MFHIIHVYFVNLLNQKEIAKKINLSQAYISRRINKIIDIVEEELRSRGLIEKRKIKKMRGGQKSD